MAFRLRQRASDDILDIMTYIAADNPAAARAWQEDLFRRFALLAQRPELGRRHFEIRPSLRIFPTGHYLIFFQQAGPDIDIVRVIHGARDWQKLIK